MDASWRVLAVAWGILVASWGVMKATLGGTTARTLAVVPRGCRHEGHAGRDNGQDPCRCPARLPLLAGSLAFLAGYLAFSAVSLALLAGCLVLLAGFLAAS